MCGTYSTMGLLLLVGILAHVVVVVADAKIIKLLIVVWQCRRNPPDPSSSDLRSLFFMGGRSIDRPTIVLIFGGHFGDEKKRRPRQTTASVPSVKMPGAPTLIVPAPTTPERIWKERRQDIGNIRVRISLYPTLPPHNSLSA